MNYFPGGVSGYALKGSLALRAQGESQAAPSRGVLNSEFCNLQPATCNLFTVFPSVPATHTLL